MSQAATSSTARLCRSGGCYQTIPGIIGRCSRLLRAFHHGERLEGVHVTIWRSLSSHGCNGFAFAVVVLSDLPWSRNWILSFSISLQVDNESNDVRQGFLLLVLLSLPIFCIQNKTLLICIHMLLHLHTHLSAHASASAVTAPLHFAVRT